MLTYAHGPEEIIITKNCLAHQAPLDPLVRARMLPAKYLLRTFLSLYTFSHVYRFIFLLLILDKFVKFYIVKMLLHVHLNSNVLKLEIFLIGQSEYRIICHM